MEPEQIKEAYADLAMTPREMRDAQEALRLSRDEFTVMLGVATPRTVRRWEEGEKDIPGPVVVLLDLLLNCPEARRYLQVGEYLPEGGYLSVIG